MPRRRWTRAGVYEPDVLDTLARAYEDIMPIVTAPAGPYGHIDAADLQAKVADAILAAARKGDLDLDRLEGAALKRLADEAGSARKGPGNRRCIAG